MILKNSKVWDIVPQFLRLIRNILAAQIPIAKLGQLVNFISQHKHVQFVDDLARMDAICGVAIVSRLSYSTVREQIRQRPRIKLSAASLLVLFIALLLAGRGVAKLETKKPEIKVNGQAVLIAEAKPNDEVAQLDAEIGYRQSPFDFKMPVQGYISQSYRGYHRAIDIATGRVGVPILALGKGQVEFAGYLPDGKGNVVIVDHGDGLKSLYAHMGNIRVGVGNQVDSTTALGTVGLTGHTTGAHLHLEIYDNEIAVDPAKVLPPTYNPLGLAPKAGAVHNSNQNNGI